MPSYVVAVRALCEFTAKRGDLDLRFTPSPTAEQGIAGHAAVAARRGASRTSELSLSGEHRTLTVRGRADGWDAARGVLEEVKTHRGDLARQPANHRALHWAQLKVYGALLCRQLGLPAVSLALVYYDVGTQRETVFEERHDAAGLQAFFAEGCDRFIAWAEQELAHAARRDAALAALRFPHAGFRPGQRRLAEHVYRAAAHGRPLLAQAPTGIGKTMGTLFPLLKAWPAHGLQKVFFLTAKGTGRQLALAAARRLHSAAEQGLPLRVVELVARDKACEFPDKACHGESCPLAAGFYDRLPAARAAAVAGDGRVLDRAALRELALAHEVCPYWLGQALARWADVVVGDVNHWFDVGSPLLHGLTLAEGWKVAVLVDEAHNLLERARAMYSATLDQQQLARVRRTAPRRVKGALDRLHRAWNTLHAGQAETYAQREVVPDAFADALQNAIVRVGEQLADEPVGVAGELLSWHFEMLHFARLLESFDAAHSMLDVTLAAGAGRHRRSVLSLRNAIPAPFLKPRFAAAATTTLFSATLTPREFHADVLGLPADTAWLDVESPFGADQLAVRIAGHVSTRYADRDASLAPIVELIARQHDAAPGNYLAFFSSFEYLDQAAALFASRRPDIAIWCQSRGMGTDARERFLARFDEGAEAGGIGFAVLGGAFGEGIDLPGRRLIGAFIATLGLPPLNPVNEAMKQRMAAAFGRGHEYTYLYPGLQKVVQAAGRVIRGEDDRGVVVLIDDRFARAAVRRLLPAWWRVEPPPSS